MKYELTLARFIVVVSSRARRLWRSVIMHVPHSHVFSRGSTVSGCRVVQTRGAVVESRGVVVEYHCALHYSLVVLCITV